MLNKCPFAVWLFVFCLSCTSVKAQNGPYRLQTGQEIGLFGGGGLLLGASFLLDKGLQPLSSEELKAAMLNPQCPPFECFVHRQWNPPAQRASDVLLLTAPLLPFALLLDEPMRKDALPVGVVALETYLLTSGLTSLTKSLTRRTRPYVFNPEAPMERKLSRDARRSFFSGHTSMAAAASFVTAQMYSDYHPNSRMQPYVWATAATLPAVMGYLRVRGGKHYVTDVIVGYVVGAGIGLLVPALHRGGEN